MLGDKEIRSALINFFDNKKSIKRIIQELRVHDGNAIADVVTISKTLHCYEIKSDLDNIYRIIEQGHYYNKCFEKITLVITDKNLLKAIEIAPPFWGIIVAKESKSKVKLNYIRGTQYNKSYEKQKALLTLWRDELLQHPEYSNKKTKISRLLMSEEIGNKYTRKDISYYIAKTIRNRKSNFSNIF